MADIWMDVDTALSEVPVNVFPLTDDTDFKTRETSVAYDAAGMDLVWNFVTTGGAFTQTAVTPTTGGSYDWTHQGDGMYTIEIPASGGASINNDTEGFGWFSGVATGVLPWRGPIIGFRASGINNKLIDDAYSTERGLAGTALPAAAADAAGGLPISDAGGLDLDTLLSTLTNETYGLSAIETLVDELETRLTAARAGYLDELSSANIPADIDTLLTRITDARMGALTDWINGGRLDNILDTIAGDVAGLDGAAMRGTDNAALASAWTATRAGYIDLLNTYLDVAISSRLAATGYTAPDNTNIGNIHSIVSHVTYGLSALYTLLTATGIALTTAERTAIANEVESQIIDDTDSEKVLTAITDKIASVNPSLGDLTLSAIASAVWAALVSGITTENSIGKRIIDFLTGDIFARIGANGAGLTALGDSRLANLDAAITSRLASDDYAAPDNATISAIAGYLDTEITTIINHLTDIKGAGWATESLKNIRDAITTLRGVDNDTLKSLSDQIDGIEVGGGGGDATAENQAAIIAHLEGMKGATFSESTDSLEAIRNRGDAAWITGGGATGSNAVEITVTDGNDIPIQDAKVEIWNSDESALVTYGTTDAEGVVNLTANDGTYRVRMIKGGYAFTTQYLVVDGNETETYTGTTRTPAAPESPDVCRLYEYLFLPDGTPPALLSTRAAVLNIDSLPFDDDSAIYSGAAIAGIYSATTGLIYWDVVQGAVVRVTIGAFGIAKNFTVPATATARISDI